MRFVLVAIFTVLAWILSPQALAAPRPSGTPRSTILRGGPVDLGNGRTLERGLVELRGDRIIRVEPDSNSARLPEGATIVELNGHRITPGFIAAQTTLGLDEISMEPSTLDAERTTGDLIRAAHDVSSAIHAQSSLIAVQAIEGITSAIVSPRGGLVSGQSAWIDLLTGEHTTIVTARRIAMTATLGNVNGNSRAAILAKLVEVLDDTRFYASRRAAFDRRQARDLSAHRLDLEALEPVLRAAIPLVVEAHRVSDMLAILDIAKTYDLDLVLVGATQAWEIADVLADAKVTVILQPSENLPNSLDQLGARLDTAARLAAAGVEVGIAIFEDPHNLRNLRQEAGIAVAEGLDPKVALQAITLTLARAYGMQRDYGSIEVGKIANLVVWNGDPFEFSSSPQAVFIRGTSIPLESRQTELRDRYLKLERFRRPPPRPKAP